MQLMPAKNMANALIQIIGTKENKRQCNYKSFRQWQGHS